MESILLTPKIHHNRQKSAQDAAADRSLASNRRRIRVLDFSPPRFRIVGFYAGALLPCQAAARRYQLYRPPER